MGNTPIPSAQVGIAYLSEPDEDMLRGDELRDGMVVLISGAINREDPDGKGDQSGYRVHRLLETSRWCRVTKFRITPRVGSPLISFVGVYADGSKFDRTYDASYFWYVKPEGEVAA